MQVEQEPCHLLTIRVIRGRNISKGRLQDMRKCSKPVLNEDTVNVEYALRCIPFFSNFSASNCIVLYNDITLFFNKNQ